MINITDQIISEYENFLDQVIDWDFYGKPIYRRDTAPYTLSKHSGLLDFAAGFQMAKNLYCHEPEKLKTNNIIFTDSVFSSFEDISKL